MPSKYIYIYTDGGTEKWAFIVVKDNIIIHEEFGVFGLYASTSNEDTESEGIFRAVQYARDNPGNYILTTDSQAIINKVNGNIVNATGNPNIRGIQSLLKEIKESHLPVSFTIRWEKRLSNEYMKRADALCRS
jgi:ribonuclease HI